MRYRNVCLVFAWCLACGEATRDATPEIEIVAHDAGELRSLAEMEGSGPVEVILRLTGPDGTRIERIESRSGHGRARLDGLSPGRWSLVGDGLDEKGMIVWSARRVWFDVRADQATTVRLEFERVE